MRNQVADEESQERNGWKTMILGYDRNPNLSTDQKLQSLINELQRALDEMKEEIDMLRQKIEEREE